MNKRQARKIIKKKYGVTLPKGTKREHAIMATKTIKEIDEMIDKIFNN